MRVAKNINDVNIIIRDIYNQLGLLGISDGAVDFKGRVLSNVGDGKVKTDVATINQIPPPTLSPTPVEQAVIYTIVFSKDSPLTDLNTSPAFVIGNGKVGIPIEVWVNAEGAPSGGDLTVNPTFNGTAILANPLTLPSGSTDQVNTSTFIDPVPVFALRGKVLPGVITANGASLFSLGVVVKVTQANQK